MSNGRLDMTVYAAEELVPGPEIGHALAKRLIEFSVASGGWIMGDMPEAELEPGNWPPLIVRSFQDQNEICFYRGLNDLTQKGMAKYGIQYFMPTCEGPTAFWSKKPMNSIEEIKGFKMRAWGYFVEAFTAVGAQAVYLPHSEVYTAIATGVLDGSCSLGTLYDQNKYHELCPYYYDRPLNAPAVGMMASMAAWNELPDDLKTILYEAMMSFRAKRFALTWHDDYLMKAKFSQWGTKIITWPDKDLNKITEVSVKLLDKIASKSPTNAEGMKIVKDFLKEKGYIQ